MRKHETTSRIMSSIRSKNTEPELILGRAMWRLGLRYRKTSKMIGKPDFVFTQYRIAIFCDGDFWHGNNWRIRGLESLEKELDGYSEFWRNKILRNISRDNQVNQALSSIGWIVLRFWESKIRVSPEECAGRVLFIISNKCPLINRKIR